MADVTAPMVGRIISVDVKVGDKVAENQKVAVLEAMKLEMDVVSPDEGTVKEINISPGINSPTSPLFFTTRPPVKPSGGLG